jgi:hypothetical protein
LSERLKIDHSGRALTLRSKKGNAFEKPHHSKCLRTRS